MKARLVRSEKVYTELERIRAASDGLLSPADVVRAARAKRSPLHGLFTWDDTAAAQEWRIHEARNLIRVIVQVLPQTGEETTVYVSLSQDRKNEGGYRHVAEVIYDDDLRTDMLATAMDELRALQKKYKKLKELAAVFAALEEVDA